MSSFIRKIELVANLAIIVVAILLGVVLIRSYILRGPSAVQTPEPAPVRAGTKLSLPNVDWKANGRTLVLALSTQCHFCTESVPFYQRIVQQRAAAGNLRLVAVFPQTVDESKEYLRKLGLAVDDIQQTQFDSIGVKGTPTLIMADDAGTVTESWRGKLPREKESELLARLK